MPMGLVVDDNTVSSTTSPIGIFRKAPYESGIRDVTLPEPREASFRGSHGFRPLGEAPSVRFPRNRW